MDARGRDDRRNDRAAAAAALRDPTRRALVDFVARSDGPISIAEAVSATGIPASTAATHLDRLVDARVLDVRFERRTGRSGPGAGRPAKVYLLAHDEIVTSIPARDYELMGEVLAGALETAEATGAPVSEAIRVAAGERGRQLLGREGDLAGALAAVGYEPVIDDAGVVRLANCPFHRLASGHADLVCRANLALVGAMATDDAGRDAVLDPAPGRCCVLLVPTAFAASGSAS